LGVGAILLGLLAAGSFAAAPPNTKKHHHVITGTVTEVDHNKGKKGHGLIKVRTHHHTGNSTAKTKAEHVVTVHVNSQTRFEKETHTGKGKGGATRDVLAHFRDVEPGMHVRVKTDHNHHAQEVTILVHHAKNKNKK
jgi:hypothetical protein